MAHLNEVEITDLPSFISAVDDIRNNDECPMWYRGCGSTNFELKPSLYRRDPKDNFETYYNLEKKIISQFKQRAIPFLASAPNDDWETLFIMQHYGVPTRLLDWSESPFVALFFALTSAVRRSDDSAVWVLKPEAWNQVAFGGSSRSVVYSVDELIVSNRYGFNLEYHDIAEKPAAIIANYNNPRIVAQRGTFTISGSSLDPIEQTFQKDGFSDDVLTKLVVKSSNVATLLNSLLSYGITDSTIYPDLSGLALELRRKHGFEVN